MTSSPADLPSLLRQRLRAEADAFAAVAEHGTIVGTAREIALVNFFRGIVPRRYEILTGAIATAQEGELKKATGQLDVMVVDTFDYPALLRSGDLAVALAASVVAVVESKSDLHRGDKFARAMKQIGRAKVVGGRSTLTALYCFGEPTTSSLLRKWLQDVLVERQRFLDQARAWTQQTAPLKPGAKEKKYTREELTEEAANFSASSLPDLVISDGGAIGQLRHKPDGSSSKYHFLKTSKNTPTLVALAAATLRHLAGVQPADGDAKDSLRLLEEYFGHGIVKTKAAEPLDVTDPQPQPASGATPAQQPK